MAHEPKLIFDVHLDLDSIADLGRLGGLLAARGYSAADIEGFYYGNFVNFLRRMLPA